MCIYRERCVMYVDRCVYRCVDLARCAYIEECLYRERKYVYMYV